MSDEWSRAAGVLLLALALTTTAISAEQSDAVIRATGTLYLTYDIGMGNHLEGVLIGRLIPDADSRSHFSAVTTGQYAGPVQYLSIRPNAQILDGIVGVDEAARLSKDKERIVKVQVQVVLKHYKAVVECDTRAYRATLLSIKPLGKYQVTTRDGAPIGC